MWAFFIKRSLDVLVNSYLPLVYLNSKNIFLTNFRAKLCKFVFSHVNHDVFLFIPAASGYLVPLLTRSGPIPAALSVPAWLWGSLCYWTAKLLPQILHQALGALRHRTGHVREGESGRGRGRRRQRGNLSAGLSDIGFKGVCLKDKTSGLECWVPSGVYQCFFLMDYVDVSKMYQVLRTLCLVLHPENFLLYFFF